MDNAQKLNDWLKKIGESVGISLSLDANHACVLAHKSGIEIVIQLLENEDLLILSADLHKVPEEAEKHALHNLYYDILTLNLLQVSSHGAVLAIDPLRNCIVLCFQKVLSSLSSEKELQVLVGAFTEVALDVQNKVSSLVVKHTL